MPGDSCYVDDGDVYVTVYWGELSLPDTIETITRRARDPDLKDAKVHVIDLSAPTWRESPTASLHERVDQLRPAFMPPKLPTVIVAPGEFFYGFASMYAVFQMTYGASRVDVVRSWKEAASLVTMSLRSAEAWARDRVAKG